MRKFIKFHQKMLEHDDAELTCNCDKYQFYWSQNTYQFYVTDTTTNQSYVLLYEMVKINAAIYFDQFLCFHYSDNWSQHVCLYNFETQQLEYLLEFVRCVCISHCNQNTIKLEWIDDNEFDETEHTKIIDCVHTTSVNSDV